VERINDEFEVRYAAAERDGKAGITEQEEKEEGQ